MHDKLRGNCVIKSDTQAAVAHIAQPLGRRATEAARYSHINFVPPGGVKKAALRGLMLRKKYKRGGLDTRQAGQQGIGSGVARARDLAAGKGVSPATIGRMLSFFARHEKNKDTPPEKGNGKIAWLLWGGDPGLAWARKIKRQMDAADKKSEAIIRWTQKP